ncbi:DUF2807 domain-containing protein [Sphingomonas sp. DBB INV C78]|uniref:head GIN domain-containing protein n=1 Tax=Sphingomonas sp. DBB INV C78 TaxID=3349434 RepID=UPI0036D2F3B2
MRLAFLSVPFALLAACSGSVQAEAESGVKGSRDFALSGFDKVDLRGPDDVTVRVGPAASVRAEGDTAILDRLEITVVGNELRVSRKKNQSNWNGTRGTAKVTVTLPVLTGASIDGSGDMTVDRVKAASFDGSVAGSGNLSVAALEAQAADLSIAGSGNITVAGHTQKVSGSIAGSGNIEAAGLQSDTASLSVMGSGNINVGARTSASVSLMGSGDATVTGGAKCTVRKMGSGDARCG